MENSNRIEIQIKQVKSLLNEFRKTKMKCLELCEKVNRELPNLLQYEVMEVTCTRKLDSLDLNGVIKLKKQLVDNLNQISEFQRDLLYQMQKNSFKKAFKNRLILSRENAIDEQLGPFEIPTYNSRIQSNQSKIDRLANFIVSLGKSMNMLRKCMIGEWEWDEENFYKYQPEYLEIMLRIEQFRMRDEQLINIIERNYQKELQSILKNGQKQQTTSDQGYQIIRIPKKLFQKKETDEFNIEKDYHPVSMIQPKRKPTTKKKPLQKIAQEKPVELQRLDLMKHTSDTYPIIKDRSLDLHTNHRQKHPSKVLNKQLDHLPEQLPEQDNYVYMVKRVSDESHVNSSFMSSISSLRSMRKKVFEDDIWDEFQKI